MNSRISFSASWLELFPDKNSDFIQSENVLHIGEIAANWNQDSLTGNIAGYNIIILGDYTRPHIIRRNQIVSPL